MNLYKGQLVNDLLNELLYFHDTLINQSEKKLFPNTGEYIYNKYIYNLNDFFLNENNAFFRVYYLKKKKSLILMKDI